MNIQITPLVEQTVMAKMQAREPFTALDISNALKANRYAVRHGDVSEIVRDIFGSGAMGFYDYDRSLIDVVTEGGSKQTQAFLYCHAEVRGRMYQRRDQDALPPVPAGEARDIAAAVSAVPPLPRPPRFAGASVPPRTSRRDGALAVPRALARQMGWAAGMTLRLTGEGCLRPQDSDQETQDMVVRVWGGLRVRVCRSKLQRGGWAAEQVTLAVQADGSLRLTPKGHPHEADRMRVPQSASHKSKPWRGMPCPSKIMMLFTPFVGLS
jgi:hypothetical protein